MDSENSSSFSGEPVGGRVQGTDWQEYFHAVRERLWIVMLCLVIGAIAAAVYMNGQRQRYQARAVLFMEQEQNSRVLDKMQGLREDQVFSMDMINTVVDLLRGYSFAQRVATRLNLQKDPRFLAGLAQKPTGELSVDDAAALLQQSMTASYRPKTRLIDIFATQGDRSLAITVANTYADEYLRYIFERRADVNRAANQFLLDESDRLRREVRASEEAMQTFRERERAASLENMQQDAEGKLAVLSKSMSDLESRRFQLDTDLAAASAKPGDTEALLRLPSVAVQPKVVELNGAIADAERQLTLLKQRYRPKHPAYIAAQTEIDALLRSRNEVLQDVVNLLREERQRVQADYDEQKQAMADQQSRLLSVTGKSVEYNDLKRAVETNTAMYNAILARIAEIDVTKGMTDSQVRIHEHAVSASALRVSAVSVYIWGILGGLAAGLGIALGLHYLDQSIKTIDQAEEIGGLPVLSAIPRKTSDANGKLDVVTDQDGMTAEGFRSLRTSLAMTTHAEDRRVFMFTSAQPAEGKTFCSTNFAASLSQQGFKTLLIDADLRRSMASRIFGHGRRLGLAEILAGRSDLAGAVIATDVPDLTVLAAGLRSPNPSELLASRRMRDLLKEALLVYDRVVIDTTPVLAVSDSLLIAPHVDVTCLVLRSFKTTSRIFLRALKTLDEINCRPVGIVFNFLPTGMGSYYYHSGKYHSTYDEKGAYG
jgi:succinoglycan biosynthesis transport protein ExoP